MKTIKCDHRAILRRILSGYTLPLDGDHGLRHWARVMQNGADLAALVPGADAEVVGLFALFHDCRRENEFSDPEHGRRGSIVAHAEWIAGRLPIDEGQLGKLVYACEHHDRGEVHRDSTIACCWDADRLDLARVGITPSARYLSTADARSLKYLKKCIQRSIAEYMPPDVERLWDVEKLLRGEWE